MGHKPVGCFDNFEDYLNQPEIIENENTQKETENEFVVNNWSSNNSCNCAIDMVDI